MSTKNSVPMNGSIQFKHSHLSMKVEVAPHPTTEQIEACVIIGRHEGGSFSCEVFTPTKAEWHALWNFLQVFEGEPDE